VRRRTALAVVLPVVALGAVAAVVVAGGGDGKSGDAAGAGGARRAGTQLVERRTLVDRAQLDGTLGYGSPAAAINRLDGTLTWLPSAGAVIRPGGRLFAVDGKPAILMDGSVPAWRTLGPGVADGVDVRQLERNLAALGYDPGTVDESFTASTAAAVKDWQDVLGLPRTGRVELGRVVFLRGPRRVAKVDATLGGTGGSGAAPASWDGAQARYAFAGYRAANAATTTPTNPAATTPTTPGATTPTTPGATTPTTPGATPTTPAEPSATPTTPSATPTTPSATPTRPTDPSNGNGDGTGSAATRVLTTTSTAQVVTAELDAADQGLARVGVRAIVTLPDGRRVAGRVARVGTVVTNGGGDGGDGSGGGDPTLPLTIRLRSTRRAGHLDQAPVAVELARTTRRNVLAVPVAGLIARAGGGYAVRVVRSGGAVAEVAVEPGLFADGYVELTGGGAHAGDRVEVPR
jgi:hypothetical protein